MKLTQTTLKQIIKEETQKALQEDSDWDWGRWVKGMKRTVTGAAAEEDAEMAAEKKAEADEEFEKGLKLSDDPETNEQMLERLKKGFLKTANLLRKYRGWTQKAKEDLESAKRTYDAQAAKKTLGFGLDDDEKKELYDKLVGPKEERLKKITERRSKLRERLNDYRTKYRALKKQIEVEKVQAAAQQAGQGDTQGAADATSDSWVGKSRPEVLQALRSEFNIKPTRNWYKKLSFRHPARVKFREWYKTSRGK